MKIKSAKFLTSCSKTTDACSELFPQICVAGRSNCGKSSLLNMLMNAKLARASQTPGRTRLVNIFEVTAQSDAESARRFYFADLPGYGYHAADKSAGDSFARLTENYFYDCGKNIVQTLCLMDIRRDPSDLDKTLINFLRDMEYPFTVVLTKADKLSGAQRGNAVLKIAAALGLARDNLIVTSASGRMGRDALLERIEQILSV